MLAVATHLAGNPYSGWWVGLFVGFGLVVVVVAVVAALLTSASRLGDQAQAAIEAFDAARAGTGALARLEGTNETAQEILAATRAAREALPGG